MNFLVIFQIYLYFIIFHIFIKHTVTT